MVVRAATKAFTPMPPLLGSGGIDHQQPVAPTKPGPRGSRTHPSSVKMSKRGPNFLSAKAPVSCGQMED